MTRVCQPVSENYAINCVINNKWDHSCTGSIIIENKSEYEIEDWKLTFETELSINSIWNANINQHIDNEYYIDNCNYNCNIKPHKSIEIGFVADFTDNTDIKNFILYQMSVFFEDDTDTDGDGLNDNYEINVSKTSSTYKDSDRDGLDDYYELSILNTDSNKQDTDNNGISDGFEDFDQDGLNNYDEYIIGTNPRFDDTDDDNINDFQECKIYNTSPLIDDTDNDGLLTVMK